MSFPVDPTIAESEHPKVASMAIVGHTTIDSAKIWVRCFIPGRWCLVVKDSPFDGDVDALGTQAISDYFGDDYPGFSVHQQADIDGVTDNTHTFSFSDLPSNTKLYYALIAANDDDNNLERRIEIGSHSKHHFRTPAADNDKLVFGFSSCHDPFSTAQHGQGAWPAYYEVLKDRNAAFCIGGGDQVYIDTNDKEDMYSIWEWLSQYKNKIIAAYSNDDGLETDKLVAYFAKIYRGYYRIYWNFFHLKKVYAQFPQYMIWDDHEIMDGWGSYTKAERKKLLNKFFQADDEATNDRLIELMFVAAKQVYQEYQHSHNPNTNTNLTPAMVIDEAKNGDCQWDYHFCQNNVAFYVLDMRGHHDYERRDEGLALLGQAQMARIKDWLASLDDIKAVFFVSPVPILHWNGFVMSMDIGGQKDDLRDEWDHSSNWQERNTLLDLVMNYSSNSNNPVTFLSGDVHSASVFEISNDDDHPKARIFNATSSAISRKPAPSKAEMLIEKSGGLRGSDKMAATRKYAMSGHNNFLTVTVDMTEQQTKVSCELYWPNGDDNELTMKKVKLT